MRAVTKVNPASYRDPSGFIFTQEGVLYRQVQNSYAQHFDLLLKSGLYENLVSAGFLLPHEEASISLAQSEAAYKILKPKLVPFISYPYEWSFSQLKDAAILTLE